ncbi:hypothetical protein CCP2SC5_1640006 [Azospirillaceae bacterium]
MDEAESGEKRLRSGLSFDAGFLAEAESGEKRLRSGLSFDAGFPAEAESVEERLRSDLWFDAGFPAEEVLANPDFAALGGFATEADFEDDSLSGLSRSVPL